LEYLLLASSDLSIKEEMDEWERPVSTQLSSHFLFMGINKIKNTLALALESLLV